VKAARAKRLLKSLFARHRPVRNGDDHRDAIAQKTAEKRRFRKNNDASDR